MSWHNIIEQSQKGETTTNKNEKQKNDIKVKKLEGAALVCILNTLYMECVIVGKRKSSNASIEAVNTFRDTIINLRKSLSITNFIHKVRNVNEEKMQNQLLKTSSKEYSTTLEVLLSKLAGNEKTKNNELFKKHEVIAELKDKAQDLILMRDKNMRYIDKRAASFYSETNLKCTESSEKLRNSIKEITNKIDEEHRAHKEFTFFLNREIEDIRSKIEMWKNVHENELQRRRQLLINLQNKRTERRTKLYELKTTYDSYKREIDEYLTYKEIKRKEAEHNEFIFDSATKIQAWWRGMMVRRGLGPYRKKKKPTKDKKK